MEPQNYRNYDHKTDIEKHNFPSDLPLRPGTNTTGKAITIRINQFKVNAWPSKDIHQYDASYHPQVSLLKWYAYTWQINIGNGAEKKGKIIAVWKSRTVQNKLHAAVNGPWLWDGNKLAWYVFWFFVFWSMC